MKQLLAWVLLTQTTTDLPVNVWYHRARGVLSMSHEITQQKRQSETCGDCAGRGTIGDGRIVRKCETCNGTGKRSRTTERAECKCQNCDCINCDCEKAIRIEWSEHATATDKEPKFALLSESWCKFCPKAKTQAEQSGVPHVVLTVREAKDRGLIRGRTSVPRFVDIQNPKRYLTGQQNPERLRQWAEDGSAAIGGESDVLVTVDAEPTLGVVLGVLAAHMRRNEQSEVAGGLFRKEITVSAAIPETIRAVMHGEAIDVADGIGIEWTGKARQIHFVGTDRVELSEPVTIKLTRWGLAMSTSLHGMTVSDDASRVTLDITGPNLTIEFRDQTP